MMKIQSIIVEGNEGYKKLKLYENDNAFTNKKIKKYRGKNPLFIEEDIEQKLNQTFESEIKLSSGGYLVISPN